MKFFQPQYRSCTDEELMELISERDEWAFEVLYDRYSQRMLQYFHRMLWQDEETAQDFLQELFIKVVEKAQTFDSSRRCSTWLYTLAGNMCKNEYRRRGVRKVMTKLDDTYESALPSEDFRDELDQQSFRSALAEEVNQLSDTHQEVFRLRYQEELPIREISEIVGCSEGTVKSRLFYGLRKLAGKLQAFDPKN
ncbi:MAG: sigma-70 family RNA polymerase sigma factor [Bacteroidota bacterium]